jgi:CRISPR/Cas system-associated protein Csx1
MTIHLLNPTEFISIIFENIAMNLVSIKIYDLNRFEFSKKRAKVSENIYFTEFYKYHMKALVVCEVCNGT